MPRTYKTPEEYTNLDLNCDQIESDMACWVVEMRYCIECLRHDDPPNLPKTKISYRQHHLEDIGRKIELLSAAAKKYEKIAF